MVIVSYLPTLKENFMLGRSGENSAKQTIQKSDIQ